MEAFIALLSQRIDVTAETSYAEAELTLGSCRQWQDLDERSRWECYKVFVYQLGTSAQR